MRYESEVASEVVPLIPGGYKNAVSNCENRMRCGLSFLRQKALSGFRVEDLDDPPVFGNQKPPFGDRNQFSRERKLPTALRCEREHLRGATEVEENVSLSHRMHHTFLGVLLFKEHPPILKIHGYKHPFAHRKGEELLIPERTTCGVEGSSPRERFPPVKGFKR